LAIGNIPLVPEWGPAAAGAPPMKGLRSHVDLIQSDGLQFLTVGYG